MPCALTPFQLMRSGYKYEVGALSEPLFGEHPLPPTMRVFVCLLSALVLCQAYDYGEVIRDSLLFYEAQRSGKLPADQKVTWRKDSALNDKGQKGEDLTGGYYDAGDFVKFGFPMAFTVTTIAWGALDQEAGYTKANALEDVRKAIKWGTDYFIKAHVSQNELYGQVGQGDVDHAYWGRPEDMTMSRPEAGYTKANALEDVRKAIKWGTDYF
ncbi:endoglucanase 11-like, partial [Zootermopsis nevadensis]|uniref:endoglucanase 11-like n=1 Tax=Zootermopsis nevadensis TaxID=136037 RepID=UPI000B8EB064